MSKITTSLFQEMVQAASTRLSKQAEYVNSLNVFPVPDGDTGTNMGMTMENGAKEVSDKPATTVGEVGQILSKGVLMGARGNSGVITSQLFRGFGQSIKDKEELTGQDLAHAFQNGVEVAYKAVMKPVEGTILTVSRGAATAALKKLKKLMMQLKLCAQLSKVLSVLLLKHRICYLFLKRLVLLILVVKDSSLFTKVSSQH